MLTLQHLVRLYKKDQKLLISFKTLPSQIISFYPTYQLSLSVLSPGCGDQLDIAFRVIQQLSWVEVIRVLRRYSRSQGTCLA